jgi:hypothetical protein
MRNRLFVFLMMGGLCSSLEAVSYPGRQETSPHRALTLDSLAEELKPVGPRIWEVYASPGVIFDNNINRLLINSTVNSNTRRPDTILHTQAGFYVRPRFGDKKMRSRFKPNFSYHFDRYDYQDNSNFSYYNNELDADIEYWVWRRFAFDTGVDANWYADERGLVTNSQQPRLGIKSKWRRWRARAGYAWRRDSYNYSPSKDANSTIFYGELKRFFLDRQSLTGYYRYRANRAESDIYSYDAHYQELRWFNPWTKRFNIAWSASWQRKDYAIRDVRFGLQRRENTYDLQIEPGYTFLSFLRLAGGWTYSFNNSNAETKDFIAQIYSARLEIRF